MTVAGPVMPAQALDDDGGGAGDASLGDGDGGSVGEGGGVLGGLADADAGHQADHDAAPQLVPGVVGVAEQVAGQGGQGHHEDGGGVDAHVDGVQQLGLAGAVLGAHGEEADGGGHDAEAGNVEGQVDLVGGGGQGAGGNDGAHEGLKQVGAHAGDVTHVGSLGVDAASNAGEQGDGGGAEAEAGHVGHGALQLGQVGHGLGDASLGVHLQAGLHGVEDAVHGHDAGQAVAHHGEAHDGATGEGDLEGAVQGISGGHGGHGGLDVGLGGDVHAAPASQGAQEGANHECHGGLPAEAGAGGVLGSEHGTQEDGHAHHEDGKVLVLGHQEGLGAGLDLFGNRGHQLAALVGVGVLGVAHAGVAHDDHEQCDDNSHSGDGDNLFETHAYSSKW